MLEESDIVVGKIIWYYGTTSTSAWNCPAEIIQVNLDTKTFKVKSLDDMQEQNQVYDFVVKEDSPESRKSMYVPEVSSVRSYLNTRIARLDREAIAKMAQVREAEMASVRISYYLSRSDLRPTP